VALAATIACSGGLGCVGTDDDDRIQGSNDDEHIYGLGGSDIIDGNGGSDHVVGDRLASGEPTTTPDGDDKLDGGPGDDGLYGYGGNDTLIGGPGDDKIDARTYELPLAQTPDGHNIIKAGGGDFDEVDAVNGVPDSINCGAGSDDFAAVENGLDKVANNCEHVQ
jgi:Ca2+-binding RTX toxin-like protein